ncbi:MAG: hypothetical protein WDM89_19495 [Rhizomicrobium sp.]
MPNELPDVATNLDVPAFGYYALLATTASLHRTMEALTNAGLGHVRISERMKLSWPEFISADWKDLPRAHVGEARRYAASLLNKAIATFVRRKGTLAGTLANNRPFWFFANSAFPKNEVKFTDFRGVSVRRQLVGYSNKRRVYWHFGIQVRSSVMGGDDFFLVSPHVTFSADGTTLLLSKAQLHSLRRSFCKSWWNKRWRDLLQGFIAALADGGDRLSIDLGGDVPLVVSSRFRAFVSPISPSEDAGTEEDASVAEDFVEDEWDEVGEIEHAEFDTEERA